MTLPNLQPRRTIDAVTQTIVSVALIAGASVLAVDGVFDVGSTLAAYALAGAVSGLPIVVKRDGGSND